MGNVSPRSDIGPKPAHSEDIALNDDIAANGQKKLDPPPKDLSGEMFWMHLLPKIAADDRSVLAFESASILPL